MPSKQHIISFKVLSLVAREISFILTVAHTFNFFHQGFVFFFCFSLFIFQFFCHFQVLQFFLEVHHCQGLDSWSRLIVTLNASQNIGTQSVQELFFLVIGVFVELFTVKIWFSFFGLQCIARRKLEIYNL